MGSIMHTYHTYLLTIWEFTLMHTYHTYLPYGNFLLWILTILTYHRGIPLCILTILTYHMGIPIMHTYHTYLPYGKSWPVSDSLWNNIYAWFDVSSLHVRNQLKIFLRPQVQCEVVHYAYLPYLLTIWEFPLMHTYLMGIRPYIWESGRPVLWESIFKTFELIFQGF